MPTVPPADPATLPPLLLPRPRSVQPLGGWLDLRSDPLGLTLHRRDATLPPGGYRLHVGVAPSPDSVVVVAADDAGITHASATIGQLFRQYRYRFPRIVIEDAPAIATRGLMLDVSRDRVPTNEMLHRISQQMGNLKLNHLQLYTEHTFAYPGHEEVWGEASPITPQEVRALDAWCRGAGVSLAANQNCFGHLARWLRHPRYAPLAETHGDYDFYGLVRKGPHSLCPTDEASLELVCSWLDALLPCFSTRMVNIGCDETADVGAGRSRRAVEQRGGFEVYREFVERVAAAARARGSRPMIWADVALRHPDRVAEFPEDILFLVWGYEASSPFEQWCQALRDTGREFWVCPGTSCWRSITGRTRERVGNIEGAVGAAQRRGAGGVMVTAWGDLGHRQQQPITDLGVADAAAQAWNPGVPLSAQRAAISLQVYEDRSLQLADWLDALGDVDSEIRAVSGKRSDPLTPAPLTNASTLFEHLHPCGVRTHLPTDVGPWHAVRERLATLRSRLPVGLHELHTQELLHTLEVAEFACRHAIWTRSETRDATARSDLRDRLEAIIVEHHRLWLVRARPGGLGESAAWYEGLRSSLQ